MATVKHSGTTAPQTLQRRTSPMTLAEKIAFAQTRLSRARALTQMVRAFLWQEHVDAPEPQHLNKCIELAIDEINQALNIHYEERLEELQPTILDRALGALSCVDTWIWGHGWADFPKDECSMALSLDSAIDVINDCLASLAKSAPVPDRLAA